MAKGLCGYCLGEKTILKPLNDDPKQAELNNFVSVKCPVCEGTGEYDLIDEEDLDEINPLTEDDFSIPDDLDEFLEKDYDLEDNEANDINNPS